MSKSVLDAARDALTTGEAALARYASRCSRRDYTRPQLFALLVVRQLLKVDDYRGVVALAAEWRGLREALGFGRVPHSDTGAPLNWITSHAAQLRAARAGIAEGLG